MPSGMADDQALEIVDRTIAEGDVIEVERDEDIIRLARVVFLRIGGKIPEKDAAQIGAVLANRSVSAIDRLEFVENHILKSGVGTRWKS